MGILLPVILAVTPPVLFLIWILRFDRYEKEPLGYVLKMLFLGCLSVIPAAFLEVPILELSVFQTGGVAGAALQSFLVIAPVEELAKLLVFFLFVWKNKNFNESNDGIVYAGAISIGFALAENLLYVLEHGIAVGIARALTSIPGHTFTGVLMGYFLGLAKFGGSNKAGNIARALLIPWLLHATYDTFALSGTSASLLVIPMVVFYFIAGIRYLKKGRALSAARWADSALPAEPEYEPLREPLSKRSAGCRRVSGVTLLVLSGIFWALIILGLLFGSGVEDADLSTVLGGAMLITALPVTAGVLLITLRRNRSSLKGYSEESA